MSNILAVIPARGGSQRIPRKNLRQLGGKPLMQWTIETALATAGVSAAIVSTDDMEIAAAAAAAGLPVPWLRPSHLATDTATSADVCLHALDCFERERGAVDGVLLLSPTTPFRTTALVQRGIELFTATGDTVIGVSPAKPHPMWCFEIREDALEPMMGWGGLELRSQDLPPAYAVNGSFYLTTPAALRRRRSFYGERLLPLVGQGPGDALDIDDEADWLIAEAMLQSRQTFGAGVHP